MHWCLKFGSFLNVFSSWGGVYNALFYWWFSASFVFISSFLNSNYDLCLPCSWDVRPAQNYIKSNSPINPYRRQANCGIYAYVYREWRSGSMFGGHRLGWSSSWRAVLWLRSVAPLGKGPQIYCFTYDFRCCRSSWILPVIASFVSSNNVS